MEIADICYFDGSKIQVQTVQKGELERLLKSSSIKHKPTDYWDDCYELNGEYLLNIEDAGFMFESVDSMLKFLCKTSFLRNPLNRQFIFFELVEKNELGLLMNAPPKGFKKKESFMFEEVYQFDDGQILFADKYLRSGEIFMTEKDYGIYKQLIHGE